MTPTLTHLYELIDPCALCYTLAEEMGDDPAAVCDGTLARSRVYIEGYSAEGSWDETVILLEELGGYCDCEVLYNVAPQVEEAEEIADPRRDWYPDDEEEDVPDGTADSVVGA